MKKNILALAIGAVMTATTIPAMSADVSISGRAHVSMDHLDNGAASGMNVSSNSSRIRFAAKTDVTEGLEAMMQLEQNIRYDQGEGGTFASRDTFVGLKGDFGMVRFGYFDTPLKSVRSRTDMFGDRIGDARNLTSGMGMSFDKRYKNGVHYRSPSMNGLVFDLHYTAHDEAGHRTTDNLNNAKDSYSTSVSYRANDLFVVAAYEVNGTGDSNDNPTAVRLGATYNVVKGFRVAGFYQDAKNVAGGDRNIMGVGAYYDLTSEYRLRGQFYMAGENDTKKTDANMLAVGIDRRIGKDLTLYAAYAMTTNGDEANFTVASGGRDARLTSVKGEAQTALSLGVVYNF